MFQHVNQVWNDVSCSSGAATAELRVTRTFQAPGGFQVMVYVCYICGINLWHIYGKVIGGQGYHVSEGYQNIYRMFVVILRVAIICVYIYRGTSQNARYGSRPRAHTRSIPPNLYLDPYLPYDTA